MGRTDSIYTWRGTLAAHAQLTIRNFNGPIDVRPAAGANVEFRAVKRRGQGEGALEDVGFAIRTAENGDVSICSVWRDRDPCTGERRDRWDDSERRGTDVTVAMTVLVPRGAEVQVTTGNGGISVEKVTGSNERLGKRGVGVRETWFGPGPAVIRRQRADARDGIGEQVTGSTMAKICRQHLGGAERRERHRTTMRRPLHQAVVEVRQAT